MTQVTNPQRFQEKTLDAGTTSVSFIGDPGGITFSGDADGGTITQTMTGDSVAIDTHVVGDSFYFNGQRVSFGIQGGGGSESVSIKWFNNKAPY